ncbi:MAG TPA: DUF4340 domain-containing protein [Bryobacteraceae bacterium]|nr:DUF4340 domain-containing protein [Bryobacteraceae bacterium]
MMQLRGLLIAIIALGLLAAGVYWSDRHKTAEEAKDAGGGASKLIQVASEDVRKLEIQRKDAPAILLERDASKQWQMRAPETWRVDQETANAIAESYASLSYDRVVEEKASDLSSYGLQTPSVVLTATAKDGKSGKLLIGDESPTGTGVYGKLERDPRVFLLGTNVKTAVDKSPFDVRDKRLLVFDTQKSTRVELVAKGVPVEFTRDASKEWQITKPKPLRANNGQVEDLLQKLGDARMDASAPDGDPSKIASNFAFGTRVATASVTDPNGTQTLEVRKRGEEYFAKSSSALGVFKIAQDAAEGLSKALDDFRNKKLFDFGFVQPSAVSVRDGDKSYVFRKNGEKWTNAAGKTMDATSLQALIDKIRDLSAIKFLDTGFTAPAIEIGVTSEDGKRNERVSISRTADLYVARRENEPALYQLDGKAVEELQRAAGDVKEPPPPPAKK